MKKFFLTGLCLFFIALAHAQNICNDNRNPLILVHGFLAAGDTWSSQVQRFLQNGYCRNRVFVFDWNTTGGNRATTDSLLNVWIDSARRVCGTEKADLVGHSAGGGICTAYLSDSAHAAKVAHYVHIGSGKLKGAAGYQGNIPTMSISSRGDKVLGALPDVPGVTNIVFDNMDRAEVQTSEETFRQVYAFLNKQQQPGSGETKRIPGNVSIAGRAVYFGDNMPVQTDSILVFAIDAGTGQRKQDRPWKILRTNDAGYWPAFSVQPGTSLELEIHPPGGRVISYYLGPQHNDDDLVYLRCIPLKGFIAQLFKKLPSDEHETALGIFSSSHAIVAGRDSLEHNNILISTQELTPAGKTILACFIFNGGTGNTTPSAMKDFGTGVFITGINKRIEAGPGKSQTIRFNHQNLVLPCRPSSEALMVAIFK